MEEEESGSSKNTRDEGQQPSHQPDPSSIVPCRQPQLDLPGCCCCCCCLPFPPENGRMNKTGQGEREGKKKNNSSFTASAAMNKPTHLTLMPISRRSSGAPIEQWMWMQQLPLSLPVSFSMIDPDRHRVSAAWIRWTLLKRQTGREIGDEEERDGEWGEVRSRGGIVLVQRKPSCACIFPFFSKFFSTIPIPSNF